MVREDGKNVTIEVFKIFDDKEGEILTFVNYPTLVAYLAEELTKANENVEYSVGERDENGEPWDVCDIVYSAKTDTIDIEDHKDWTNLLRRKIGAYESMYNVLWDAVNYFLQKTRAEQRERKMVE